MRSEAEGCGRNKSEKMSSYMDRRYVRLDPRKLDYLRLKRGWNLDTLFERAAQGDPPLDKRTVKAIVDGRAAFLNSAKIVADLLGAEDLVSVLHPELLAEIGPPSGWGSPLEFFSGVGQWDVIEPLGDLEQAANGLRYDVWMLRHRHIPTRFGRGKCYDLSQLSDRDRTRLRASLTRHSEVCDRLGAHPSIARNYDAIAWEHEAWWWVIDEWVEGAPLSTHLADGSLPATVIPRMMRAIASALALLHSHQIIRRELSPRFIFVRSSDETPILTDFELAKLLDGSPTVSPKCAWPDDEYRALEVDSDATLDPRADVYSWGRILVHTACGQLPARGDEGAALMSTGVPPAVRKLVLACVALPPSDRPSSMSDVLHVLRSWK